MGFGLRGTGAAFSLVAMLLLGGCGEGKKAPEGGTTGASPDGKTTVDFWHYFSDEQAKPLKHLISEFEKANPTIKVNSIFQGRANELSQKLNSSFAASPANNPAMATLYENWTSDFVSKDYLDAMEDHINGPDGMTKEEVEDIVKVFREGNTWNGKFYTMPFNKSIYVLYYNTDMLKAADITTAPKTLEEYKDAVRKTTLRDGARVKTYGLGVAPLSEAFTTLLYANGGEYFDANNNPTFDSPEGLAALTFLKELQFPDKHLYVSTDYMNVPFGNQHIAMYVYSSASFPYNEKAVAGKFEWGVAGIPGSGGDKARYVMQGTNIGIFKNRPEAERAAAWKFVKFLTETKNAVYWETRSGYMPIRYSVLKDPDMVAFMEKNPKYAYASSLVLSDKGKQEPKIAVWEGIREDLNGMVDRVLSGADPKAELAATQAKAAQRVKERPERTTIGGSSNAGSSPSPGTSDANTTAP